LEVQASPISTETIQEREEFYGEMAWMLKGEDFAKNFFINHVGGHAYRFEWRRPRLSWQFSNRRIYIDFSFGIFRPNFNNGISHGTGVFVPPSEIYEFVSGADFVVPECAKSWYLSASELYEKRALVNSIAMQMNEISTKIARSPSSWFRRFLELRQIQLVPTWLESINAGAMAGAAIWKNTNKYLCEVEQWKVYLCEYQNCAKEWAAEREMRLKREAAIKAEEEAVRALRDLEEQARRDEAARISAERLRQEIERQRAEQERIEKERIIALRCASLLEQSNLLRLENLRMALCDEIRSLRPVNCNIFGKWSTAELVELRDSLNAAKKRVGEARWAELVKRGGEV
jgi:hypothetical protein